VHFPSIDTIRFHCKTHYSVFTSYYGRSHRVTEKKLGNLLLLKFVLRIRETLNFLV